MVQHEAGVYTQISFARHTPIGGPFPANGIPAAAANTAVTFILSVLREMVSSCKPNWMVNGWIRRKDVSTSIKPLNELSGNRYYKIQVCQLLVVLEEQYMMYAFTMHTSRRWKKTRFHHFLQQ